MATNSKVFVSPGVYTSERDLSFVTQSVGVTTLGIVGEALTGPAFEPIFISNYDEYETYFGGTLPEKFINTQIPKYEAAYIAKSYLQQSNQMFMTRILGLSGYDAGPSWSIVTVANVNPATVGLEYLCTTTADFEENFCLTSCVLISSAFTFDFSGCAGNSTSMYISGDSVTINSILDTPYTTFNGGTSSVADDLYSQLLDVFATTGISGTSISYFGSIPTEDYTGLTSYTASTNVFGVPSVSYNDTDLTSPFNDPWYYALFNNYSGDSYSGFSFYNVIDSLVLITPTYDYPNCAGFFSFTAVADGFTGNTCINYETNTIDIYFPSSTDPAEFNTVTVTFSACTTGITLNGEIQTGGEIVNFTTGATCGTSGKTIQYSAISENGLVSEVWNVCVRLEDPCDMPSYPCTTGSLFTGDTDAVCYSGSMSGVVYYYTGTSFVDYNNLVVTTLRSRGISEFSSTQHGADFEVETLNNVSLNFTGTYSAVTTNPYAEFGITVINDSATTYNFKTSLLESNSTFISKVFGKSNFAKPRTEVPLFVEETFMSMLNWAYKKGYIKGLNSNLVKIDSAKSNDLDSIGYYREQYQTPRSPWLVSELRGNNVYKLFRFVSVADGNSANEQIKISVVNLSFNNLTFDLLIRSFYDTDEAPQVLEKFTNCTMDPGSNSFIAKKIGTPDGEYALNSKYIMVEMNEDAPVDALPCGFEGYNFRNYQNNTSPFPVFKTKYDYPGEVIYNPPFGYSDGSDNPALSSGDNVRKTYLGISSKIGWDTDFYQYVGKQNLGTLCAPALQDWNYITKGFHMDSGATVVVIPSGYTTSGQPAFNCGVASFTSDPNTQDNPYYYLYSRKFTLLVGGGFDGWDVYREYRTNRDRFRLGGTGYLQGACASVQYSGASGDGAFKKIKVGDNTQDWANTDYYAYLLGQQTFSNPEAVNINVFVTPGIDFVNNSNLIEDAIEMIEFNRADSLYVCTTPDYNMYVPTSTNPNDLIYPQEIVDDLNNSGIDSNYTATYYPWVLTRDTVNNTQIYIPATAEVTRNLALTDNIAFPWFASAGYTRGIVNSIKARKKLTQEDRDILYTGRINPIATFSDVGTVIWGNKTLQIADTALNRINVRRLLLQARKLISAVAVRLLFEQNDSKVRQDFLDSVNPILDAIRRDRGLYDFRVTVSNTPEDLDRNQMTGKIYIKPTKSLEFIDIEFLITPTGASFENI